MLKKVTPMSDAKEADKIASTMADDFEKTGSMQTKHAVKLFEGAIAKISLKGDIGSVLRAPEKVMSDPLLAAVFMMGMLNHLWAREEDMVTYLGESESRVTLNVLQDVAKKHF